MIGDFSVAKSSSMKLVLSCREEGWVEGESIMWRQSSWSWSCCTGFSIMRWLLLLLKVKYRAASSSFPSSLMTEGEVDGAKGNNSAISTSLLDFSFHASSSTMMPLRTPTSSHKRETMSTSQPGKRTVRTGPEGVAVREMGRSPKRERRWRSVRITERSLRARAKSMDKLSRRPRVLRVVVES